MTSAAVTTQGRSVEAIYKLLQRLRAWLQITATSPATAAFASAFQSTRQEQQRDGDEHVHDRAGADDEHAARVALVAVGPRFVGGVDLVEVVHADDPHERTERQLMQDGATYDEAHDIATAHDKRLRRAMLGTCYPGDQHYPWYGTSNEEVLRTFYV